MNIRFTSSLTPDDENAMAQSVLRALVGILDRIPIAYSIRIDTSDAHVYQHSKPIRPAPAPEGGPDRGGLV